MAWRYIDCQIASQCEFYLFTQTGFTDCDRRGQGYAAYSSEQGGHVE